MLRELRTELFIAKEEKEDLLSSVVTTKFKSLVGSVKNLRQCRTSAPTVGEIFPPKLQAIVDLYGSNSSSDVNGNMIALSTMKPFQNILGEEASLKIQTGLIVNYKSDSSESLEELIEEKEDIIRKCAKYIKNFLKHLATLPLEKRENELTDAMEFLTNNYPEIMDGDSVQPTDDPLSQLKSLENAVLDCKSEANIRAENIQKFRDLTNESSSKLFKVIGQLQRECHCVVSISTTSSLGNLDNLMEKYQEAIEREMLETQVYQDLFTF